MFKFAKNISGYTLGPRDHYIANTTAIEKGEIVKYTAGTGIVTYAEYAQPRTRALGVAAHAHDGATDDGVNKEYSMKIYDHPDDIFQLEKPVLLTATGGSTTTFVDSGLLPATDDVMNDGYLEIVSCAADSSLNGKMIKITDHTGSGGTLTFATQPATFASGDTAYLWPGKRAIGYYAWNLNSDGTAVDYATGSGDGYLMQLWDVDPERKKAFFKLRMHVFGHNEA